MARKIPEIPIVLKKEMHISGRELDKPLTNSQIRARMAWMSEEIPLRIGTPWHRWALVRLEELKSIFRPTRPLSEF